MTFEWKDPNAIVGRLMQELAAAGRRVSEVPPRAVRKGAFLLLSMVQERAPKRTSTLVRSLSAQVEEVGPLVRARIGSHLRYALAVEEGTGLYGPKRREIVIRPARRRALFWGAMGADGRPVFARQVRIKGMRPRAMLAGAVEQFEPRYMAIVEKELSAK